MSRNDELNDTWELHRQNAELHRPGCGRPPCPICLSPIARPGQIAAGAVEASCGHVVPETAGAEGRGIVLECKVCNNRFGHWYDVAYASQLATDRFRSKLLGREAQIKLLARKGTWLTFNGVPASAKIRDTGNGLTLELHLQGPAPDRQDGFKLAMVDPPIMRVVASLVHSAYLRLVWHLGYEYVFAHSVQGLRQRLHRAVLKRQNNSELEKPFHCYGITMLRHERIEGWMELSVVHDPVSLPSFVISVPGIEGRAYTLFLPGFGSGAGRVHKRMQAAKDQRIRIKQFKWDAPREQRLTHSDARNWGRELWALSLAKSSSPAEDGNTPSGWRVA